MPPPIIKKLNRVRGHVEDGRPTLFFSVNPNSRRGKWVFFRPDQVPEFDGEVGWFECEKLGGRGGWRVVRQVEKPSWER